MVPLFRLALLLVAGLLAACYDPSVRNCAVACSGPGQCAPGQVCGTSHFCMAEGDQDKSCGDATIPDAPPDAPAPPDDGPRPDSSSAACNADTCPDGTCDATGVCMIQCAANGSCASQVVCPPGLPCLVVCSGRSSCAMGVDCGSATDCRVLCTERNSCAGRVTCGDACACEVVCGPAMNVCAAGVTCSSAACTNGTGCTSQGTCDTCGG